MKSQIANHPENQQYLPEFVNKTWLKMLEEVEEKIKLLEEEVHSDIKKLASLEEQYNLLQSIPGISKTTALAVLAELPEIASFKSARQLAAYIGITPKHRQSGTSLKGRSRISKVG